MTSLRPAQAVAPSAARTTALILAVLAPVKIWLSWDRALGGDTGKDGGYYLDVAQNVRDGLGLVTDVSPFHQGLPYFPHPSTFYPLWPWLLGYLGRWVPLEFLAYALPAALYVLSLVLAIRVAPRYFPGTLGRIGRFEIHSGHLLALLLGLHRNYLQATSLPYTEGLAYVLVLLVLGRAASAGFWTRARSGAELGFWAGLLFLCRAQLLVFAAAAAAVLGLRAVRGGGRREWGALVLFFAVFAAVFAPMWVHIARLTDENPLLIYFRFDQFQATPLLPKYVMAYPVEGASGWLLDRLRGVAVAFSPGSGPGYMRAYLLVTYLVPLALVLWLRGFASEGKRRVQALWTAGASRPDAALYALFTACAVAALHGAHMREFEGWMFGGRQGVVAVFLFLPAAWLLLRRGGRWRIAATALLAVSFVYQGGAAARQLRWGEEFGRGFVHAHRELIERIRAESPERGRLVLGVPFDLGKLLAPHTPGAAYQEYFDVEHLNMASVFVCDLGVRHWLLDLSTARQHPEAVRSSFLHRTAYGNSIGGIYELGTASVECSGG